MKAFQLFLLLLSQLYYAHGEDEVVAQEGDTVALQCPVNVPECGQYHSLEWYRDSSRVFIYSPIIGYSNAEGALMDRCLDMSQAHLGADCVRGTLEATEANVELTINPMAMKDEGQYRCEITYLDASKGCDKIHSTTVKTIAPPEHVGISLKSDEHEDVTDQVVGPFASGLKVGFLCVSEGGKPEVDIKWSWEGNDDVEGEVTVEENEDGTSTVFSALELTLEREMTGTSLVCSVENEAVDEPLTVKVQLDVNVAVESMEIEDESLIGEEEQDMTVTCVAHRSRPPATFTWTLGDDSVEFTVNQKENLRDDDTYETKSEITFTPTAENNGMVVKCQATNEVMDEPLEVEKTLDILYAPRVEMFEQTNITMIENDLLELECVTDSNPNTLNNIEWYLNDQLIATENITSGDDSDDISNEDDEHEDIESKDGVLHVYNIKYQQSGDYSCKAFNDVGEGMSPFSTSVKVLYPPVVMVELSHQSRSEQEGQNLTLTCQISGGNPFKFDIVSWYLDGELVRKCGSEEDAESEDTETVPELTEEAEDHEVSLGAESGDIGSERLSSYQLDDVECLEEDVGVLEISWVDRKYLGSWTCAASNVAGFGEQSDGELLDVLYLPGTPELKHEEPWLQKGDEPTLYCDLDDPGNPAAESYVWKRNGDVIEGESSMNLTLSSLGTKDQGNNYSCQAVNNEGMGQEDFLQLDIFAKPTFLKELPEQSKFLSTGPELYLECQVECVLHNENCSIVWWREGELIGSDDDRFTIEETNHPENEDENIFESVSSRLSWNLDQFPDQKLDHEDLIFTVTCMSETVNEPFIDTAVSSNTTIVVEYPPEFIEVSETFIELKEGDSHLEPLLCSGNGVPDPSVSWKFNGEEVSDESFLNFSEPLQRDQRGDYFCHLTNEHGSQIANLTIDVLFKPTCKLTTSRVEEEEVIITCSSEANPETVSFSWSREGNITIEGQTVAENLMESTVRLRVHNETHGTYYCQVSNSVGEGEECSIEISEDFLANKISKANLMTIIGVVAAAVGILLIASICLCHYCSKRSKTGKGKNNSEKNGGTDQEKQVYENLPFNGLKTPPTKVLNPKSPDDMDYADADFKDVNGGGLDKNKASSLQKK